ncbi:hypothetical protein BDF22DRAFT_651854 [Syncephalis plumigaleata]|nr:hypothetical protein BDF22DRAFT_651854 [Syncephalis plumigaleata]
MTGIRAVKQRSNIGNNIRIAIVGGGVNYHVISRPSKKLSSHKHDVDLVGDDFNGRNEPRAGGIIKDCDGLGTMMASLLVDETNGELNVAPGAIITSYRVKGCTGHTTAKLVYTAMDKIYNDARKLIDYAVAGITVITPVGANSIADIWQLGYTPTLVHAVPRRLARVDFLQNPPFLVIGSTELEHVKQSSRHVYTSRPELAAAYFAGLVAIYARANSNIRMDYEKLRPVFSAAATPMVYNENKKHSVILQGYGLVNIAKALGHTYTPPSLTITRGVPYDTNSNSMNQQQQQQQQQDNSQTIVYSQEFQINSFNDQPITYKLNIEPATTMKLPINDPIVPVRYTQEAADATLDKNEIVVSKRQSAKFTVSIRVPIQSSTRFKYSGYSGYLTLTPVVNGAVLPTSKTYYMMTVNNKRRQSSMSE